MKDIDELTITSATDSMADSVADSMADSAYDSDESDILVKISTRGVRTVKRMPDSDSDSDSQDSQDSQGSDYSRQVGIGDESAYDVYSDIENKETTKEQKLYVAQKQLISNITESDNKARLYYDLTIDSPQILQPKGINVELRQHQKTAVHAMMEIERNGYVDAEFMYYTNRHRLLRIETQIGILNDKVGSGKTLILASLMKVSPRPIIRPAYYASNSYTTIREVDQVGRNKSDYQYIPVNVVVSPKAVHHQWIECLTKQTTNTNCVSLLDASERPNLEVIDMFCSEYEKLRDDQKESHDIQTIICNDTSVKYLFEKYSDKMFNRIIIDEADTLKLSSLRGTRAAFLWLVTGTTNGVPYSNKKYIKEIFGSNLSWQPDFLTVKNNDHFIKESMALPKPNRITISCKTPNEVELLAEHIPRNVMAMINAGNTDQATKHLNCYADTADNIYKVITTNYERAITNKRIEMEALTKKKYRSEIKKQENAKLIKKCETVIHTLKNKQESLRRSIFESNGKVCPICLSDMTEMRDTKMAMLDCCASKYCFTCVMTIVASNGNKCPGCLNGVTQKNIHVIDPTDDSDDSSDWTDDSSDGDSSDGDSSGDSSDSVSKDDAITPDEPRRVKRSKIDTLIDILTEDTKRKFLIFADYHETFDKIMKSLTELGISHDALSGGGKRMENVINAFRDGRLRVIMLNAQNFGAGLNLQCATDIVMYHRFTQGMEEQIIGRGQRMGRKGTLNVYYLIHQNERNVREDAENASDDFNDLDYEDF